jgi:hypothetical protein
MEQIEVDLEPPLDVDRDDDEEEPALIGSDLIED